MCPDLLLKILIPTAVHDCTHPWPRKLPRSCQNLLLLEVDAPLVHVVSSAATEHTLPPPLPRGFLPPPLLTLNIHRDHSRTSRRLAAGTRACRTPLPLTAAIHGAGVGRVHRPSSTSLPRTNVIVSSTPIAQLRGCDPGELRPRRYLRLS